MSSFEWKRNEPTWFMHFVKRLVCVSEAKAHMLLSGEGGGGGCSSVTRQQASRPPHPLSRACQKLPYAAGRVAAACADVPRPVADVPNDCYSWRRSLIGGDTIRRDGGLQSEQETASGREWTLAGEAHACTVWNCGLEQVLGILSPAQFWAFLRLLASGGAGEEVCVHFAALQY
jgi:hypothetical protein